MIRRNIILNKDCINGMCDMEDNSVDFTLTDIPYNMNDKVYWGLRELDKKDANNLEFLLSEFLLEVYRVTKNSICIFCGKEQFSEIYKFFSSRKGITRAIIWEKTNPSPMNGQFVYLSGIEMAVWYKKPKVKSFYGHCKNTVFRYPNGKGNKHPTQKNLELFKELIKDNSKEGDLIFDPCIGSGTTAVAAKELNRDYYGFEINKDYFDLCIERIEKFS